MRVSIKHEEVTKGFIKKTKYYAVHVDVQFTEEEMHIIKENNMENDVLLEREPGVNHATVEGHPDIHWLKVRSLIRNHPETYGVATPAEAKQYEQDVKDILTKFKAYLEENKGIEEKSTTFEL